MLNMLGNPDERGKLAQPTQANDHRRPFYRLYGRRHGRRLRRGQRQLLEQRLPQLSISLPNSAGRLDPLPFFTNAPTGVWLEIGFGAGEHLSWQAERHPNVGFLGAECYVNGIAVLLRQIESRGLENIRVLQGDGRELLAVLPRHSLGRVFILFPDPWPKGRHRNRRIVQPDTLEHLRRVIKPGGELRLCTDDHSYIGWMCDQFHGHPAFKRQLGFPTSSRERLVDWPPTRYELKARDQGRLPVFLSLLRTSEC